MKSVIMKIVYIEQIIYPHQTLGVHIESGYIDWLVFYVTFNNISVILWQSVLLVEETRVP